MRFLFGSLCLIVIAGVCNVESLKCYVCGNCADVEDVTPIDCTATTADTCMKGVVGSTVARTCTTKAACIPVTTPGAEIACCTTDSCNSAVQQLPSLLLLVLPLIFACLFKN